MSDAQIFWLALIGSTAWGASARTYRGPGRWNLFMRVSDEIFSTVALVIALIYLGRSLL